MSDAIGVRNLPAAIQAIGLAKIPPAFTRLEPQSVSGDPSPGLEARVHDPLWLLGRQWHMGEQQGENASTPLVVGLSVSMSVPAGRSAESERMTLTSIHSFVW